MIHLPGERRKHNMKPLKPIRDEHANLLTIRDPMILPVGDTYYLTGTQPPYWQGANDGVHLWSTKDLVHFEDHGLILKREDMPEAMWCRDRFWAPELFDGGDGYFYLTFNCKNDSQEYGYPLNSGIARSRSITGPYEILTAEKAVSHSVGEANDATMFRDDDGSVWIGFNNTPQRLLLHRLDMETFTISEGQITAEIGAEGEWDHLGLEGQCIVKRCGLYFQWYSSWTNGYNSGLLVADSIRGPWKKSTQNPILADNDIWHHAGHNHSFRGFDGRDYLIFHANPQDPNEPPCESMYIVPISYHEDGTVTLSI